MPSIRRVPALRVGRVRGSHREEHLGEAACQWLEGLRRFFGRADVDRARRPSVTAAVHMMANIVPTPDSIPAQTSTRIASRWGRSTVVAGWSARSSTSSDACQKTRYGEMVVPAIAR